jgi:hypothetical protein
MVGEGMEDIKRFFTLLKRSFGFNKPQYIVYDKFKGRIELTKGEMIQLVAVEITEGRRIYTLHRTDGPAWIYDDLYRYYINGVVSNKQEVEAIHIELENMSLAERLTDPREWVRNLRKEGEQE